MMKMRTLAPLAGCLVVLIAFGCAGSVGNPLNPPEPTPQGSLADREGVAPVGHYLLTLNNGQASLTPLPTAQALGDSAGYDVTRYFTASPCVDCARIDGVGLTADNKLTVDIALQHPFRDVTARADLDAFDVRGILGVNGAVTFPNTPGLLEAALSTDPDVLTNADGYTTHFAENLEASTATLNPFKRYFTEDDPSPTTAGGFIPNGRIAMGSAWDVQRYILNPTAGPVTYDFIIEASYGRSSSPPTEVEPAAPGGILNPIYFLPEFNQKEAFQIGLDVAVAPASEAPGTLSLDASATDWQVGYSPDELYPNPEFTDRLSASSNIASVMLEVPGLNLFTSDPTTASGSGAVGDPTTWTFDFALDAQPEGKYPALLTVVDERYDPTNLTASQQDYRAFQVVKVRLAPGGQVGELPVAVLESNPAPAVALLRNATFEFVGANSYDPDAVALVDFEFDFDYVGSTFDVDFVAHDPFDAAPTHTYTEVGNYTCAFRVRNDAGELSEVVTLPVIVQENPIILSPSTDWISGVDLTPEYSYAHVDTARDSAVAVGPDGKTHVIWIQEEEGIFVGVDVWIKHATVSATGVVSSPVDVYHEFMLDSYDARAAIAVSPTNTISVVFAMDSSELMYTSKGTGAWTPPVLIAAADLFEGEALADFDLAIAANGWKACVYEVHSVSGPTVPARVRVSLNKAGAWVQEMPLGNGWGPSEETGGSLNATIASLGNGFVVAWAGGPSSTDLQQDVWMSRYNGTAWSATPQTVAGDPALGESAPTIAITGDGTVVVSYQRSFGAYARFSINGAAFSNELPLLLADGNLHYIDVVVVGGANRSVVCLARETTSDTDLGDIATLSFDYNMVSPNLDGDLIRGLQSELDDFKPRFPDPVCTPDGKLTLMLEKQYEGWARVHLVRGTLTQP